MKAKNKVYIAGPISGDTHYQEKFNAAESYLIMMGWRPINPACLPDDLDPEDYMPICLAMLQQANAILLLRGLGESAGAKIEAQFANYQGKRIFPGVENVPLWEE